MHVFKTGHPMGILIKMMYGMFLISDFLHLFCKLCKTVECISWGGKKEHSSIIIRYNVEHVFGIL